MGQKILMRNKMRKLKLILLKTFLFKREEHVFFKNNLVFGIDILVYFLSIQFLYFTKIRGRENKC